MPQASAPFVRVKPPGPSALPLDEFKLFQQSCKTKWFLQECGLRWNLCLRKSFRVPGHIDHLNAWMEFRHLPRQLGAAKPWHNNVRQQHVDATVMPTGHFQHIQWIV